ncbi:ATP-dependent DNA helicase, RecQ family [Desulfitobacterium hafniense DP7]|uniref:DNA 3'-5' helicase n=1 Tax=Desulfitobacterium hafniense DP7 TaxID=537010 RepID=G9XPY7_DESHA|nr:RecQ family ATP-dependent DNA helicase [Desulfitobacterium hafniense]EHL06281.1 ATP-dependent DNA helicase, RecQ family [Desulfitobacterium hafniense DP7]
MQDQALSLLRKMIGRDAKFHQGQWEAIESVIRGNKTLLVQRTGWGKSVVYFIGAKLLRERGFGPTIIISPLLSLMRNQIENAVKIGISAETINSDNTDEWTEIEDKLKRKDVDILLLSPERLGNKDFTERVLPSIEGGIGMLVVDEAHCISDWGHDFRPDYRRIVRIIKQLPPNVPLIATTATANQRVVNDIKAQLGDELHIIRGPLTRESLQLQVIKLADQAERLAWLYENINKIEGAGIIYCLTISDCNKVAKWLRSKGINALEYHAELSKDTKEKRRLREERERKLLNNEVKALVATVALGMGFDKPDLGFVIHYQRPGSIVRYYQEIGRAGRALDKAYAILLNGVEDDDIEEYFIQTAFPTPKEMNEIVNVIEKASLGMTKNKILKELNMSYGRVEKCLKTLEIEGIIYKEKSSYFRSPISWLPDSTKSNAITKLRLNELEDMRKFIDTEECYMRYISTKLDDAHLKNCGKCHNCLGTQFFSEVVSRDNVLEAIQFLKGEYLDIEPRKQWPAGIKAESAKKIAIEEQSLAGKALCAYGDAGWGRVVAEDKYRNEYFTDELVDASLVLLKNTLLKENLGWVTSVPSLRRPLLVKDFAMRLAEKIGLPYIDAIKKIEDTPYQKKMENSYQQCSNALHGFSVIERVPESPVLLVDDIIDSGWTLTVCGILLKGKGSGHVYPFVLAKASGLEGGE